MFGKLFEKLPPKNVVVLDGKNAPHGLCEDLAKEGLYATIFVANSEGKHTKNPKFKGGDYSKEHRAGEIKCIRDLHKTRGEGVAAVVLVRDMHAQPRELLEAAKQIKSIDGNIKILVAGGPDVGVMHEGDIEPNHAALIDKDTPGIKLAENIDGIVFDYNHIPKIKESLLTLCPHLQGISCPTPIPPKF